MARNRYPAVSAITPSNDGWFLARITGTIPATTTAETSTPGTDPSTSYTYTFVEVALSETDGSFEQVQGGRYGDSNTPGVSVTGALFAVGAVVLAHSAPSFAGLAFHLLPLTSVTPGGTGGTGDTPDGIEDGSVPALTPEGNLAPTPMIVTNYPVNGQPATQVRITQNVIDPETSQPQPISPLQPFLQFTASYDPSGNTILTLGAVNNLDDRLGWIRQLVVSAETGLPLSIADQFTVQNTDGEICLGSVTYTPQPGGVVQSVASSNMDLLQATPQGGTVPIGAAGALLAANNLSDLANAATARTNLGLGTAATYAAVAFDAAGAAAAAQSTAETYAASVASTAQSNAETYTATNYAPLASPALTGTPEAPTAAAGTNTTQLATTAFVETAVGAVSGAPTGSIVMYGGSTAPSGWLVCDGTGYSTTTYANLYAVIGYTFGGSGGSFNVPDLRGRVPIGSGQGSGLTLRATGTNYGAETVTLALSGMPSHYHDTTVDFGGGSSGYQIDYQDYGGGNTASSQGIVGLYNTGGGGSHANIQPSLGLVYIIKY